MVGGNLGDDVGNDVGDGADGSINAGNDACGGDGGDASGKGGGAPGGGRGGSSSGDGGGDGCILLGPFPFYCEDISVWYFCVWGIGKVTPPLTLSSRLSYVGVLLGGDGNCPQKLWYVNTKNYLAKKHGNRSW
jgi:hypothetical protein